MARIIQAAHIPNTTPTAIANTYPAGPGLRILASARAPVIGIAKQRRVRKSHNDTISCTRNFYLPLQPRSQPLRRHRRQLHVLGAGGDGSVDPPHRWLWEFSVESSMARRFVAWLSKRFEVRTFRNI